MKRFFPLVSALAVVGASVLPATASADLFHHRSEREHRRDMKDQWQNLAIASGVVGVLGAIKGNGAVAAAGALGAVYAGSRYESERDGRWYDGHRWHDRRFEDRRHEDRHWDDRRHDDYRHDDRRDDRDRRHDW